MLSPTLHAKYQWLITRSRLAVLPLPLAFPWQEMLAEALALQNLFVPHRDYAEGHVGWKSLCIHGLNAICTQSHEHYGYARAEDVPYGWTAIHAPVTQNYFRTVYPASRFFRVRFMWLDPGGRIQVHRDYPQARLGPVNLVLSQPSGCTMWLDGQTVPLQPGSAVMLDVSRAHWVENLSAEPRIHIIVHAEYNDSRWQEMAVKAFERTEHFQDPKIFENKTLLFS